jgi:hypothetical protein
MPVWRILLVLFLAGLSGRFNAHWHVGGPWDEKAVVFAALSFITYTSALALLWTCEAPR